MSIRPRGGESLAVELQRDWGLFVLRGAVVLAIGVFALARPSQFFFALVTFAVLAIVGGVLAIVHAIRLSSDHGSGRAVFFLEGLAGIVLGVIVFQYIHKTLFLAYTVALWTLFAGLAMLALVLLARATLPLAWLWGLLGAAFVAVACWLLLYPGAATLGPSFIVGLLATAVGLGLIILGLGLRTSGGSTH
ncbi:MAG: DUF308 domain-containing protein [Candidatus Eremiobacteraeota bacterium]|nr:DUF308 domain-containing protein [Candidatus Eremiobacteraeota bacterium]